MFANINKNKSKIKNKRRKPKTSKIELRGKAQNKKVFSNKVRTFSTSENIKVLDSVDEKENRRNIQSNTISIRDEDSNIQLTIIDRQNALKPKKAKLIISENNDGDYVLTEYDTKKKKVAELHIIPSNIEAISLVRSETETQKRIKKFKLDLKNENLTDHQVVSLYDATFIREVANNEYGLKRDFGVQNERLNLVRKIRKKIN